MVLQGIQYSADQSVPLNIVQFPPLILLFHPGNFQKILKYLKFIKTCQATQAKAAWKCT